MLQVVRIDKATTCYDNENIPGVFCAHPLAFWKKLQHRQSSVFLNRGCVSVKPPKFWLFAIELPTLHGFIYTRIQHRGAQAHVTADILKCILSFSHLFIFLLLQKSLHRNGKKTSYPRQREKTTWPRSTETSFPFCWFLTYCYVTITLPFGQRETHRETSK